MVGGSVPPVLPRDSKGGGAVPKVSTDSKSIPAVNKGAVGVYFSVFDIIGASVGASVIGGGSAISGFSKGMLHASVVKRQRERFGECQRWNWKNI